MRRVLLTAVLCLSLALVMAPTAQGRVYIDLTKPFARKLPLAIPQFQALGATAGGSIGARGSKLLGDNLTLTGLFDLLNPKTFLGRPNIGAVNYRRWSRVGAELLVVGGYRLTGGRLSLEMRLYDVTGARRMVGVRYEGKPSQLPAMIYRFADEVMRAITGEASIFSTMIAFVGQRSAGKGRPARKEIYLMRFNGSEVRRLTNTGNLALYPAWSPDGRLLTYTAYVGRARHPKIYVRALSGGSGRRVVAKPGVNLTPVFLPGGKELAMAMSFQGKTNIFRRGVSGGALVRLTKGWGIEVNPTFSPGGRKMAFVSDRDGTPQIYVKDLAGGKVKRITYGRRYCAAPEWHPKKNRIVTQCEIDGRFQLVTINSDGSDPKVITSTPGGAEDPSWSPDGRLIAFASRVGGRYQIFICTSEGETVRQITKLPGHNTDPAWSPRGLKY